MKIIVLKFKFHCNLFREANLSISQDWWSKGLAPNRRQAITWANVDQDICCYTASLCHSWLNEHYRVYMDGHYQKLYPSWLFNSLAPGRCGSNFKSIILNPLYSIEYWSITVTLFSCECNITPSNGNQQWSWQWLGVIRQQACRNMVSQGHNGLNLYINRPWFS